MKLKWHKTTQHTTLSSALPRRKPVPGNPESTKTLPTWQTKSSTDTTSWEVYSDSNKLRILFTQLKCLVSRDATSFRSFVKWQKRSFWGNVSWIIHGYFRCHCFMLRNFSDFFKRKPASLLPGCVIKVDIYTSRLFRNAPFSQTRMAKQHHFRRHLLT